mgnify:CR=1 FL=1
MLEACSVDCVILPEAVSSSVTYEVMLDAIADEGCTVQYAIPGNSYPLGNGSFTILGAYPAEENLNDASIILSFVFGVATVITCIWHFANEFRKFPCMTSGVFTNICGILWALFSLLGYLNNAMLDAGVPAFMGVRTVIIALTIAGTVLVVIRFVMWLLTELQVSKERKARLALL